MCNCINETVAKYIEMLKKEGSTGITNVEIGVVKLLINDGNIKTKTSSPLTWKENKFRRNGDLYIAKCKTTFIISKGT